MKSLDPFVATLLAMRLPLRAYAIRLTGRTFGADELVQMTIERAVSMRGNFRSGGNLRGWLFTIMRTEHGKRKGALAEARLTSLDREFDDLKPRERNALANQVDWFLRRFTRRPLAE